MRQTGRTGEECSARGARDYPVPAAGWHPSYRRTDWGSRFGKIQLTAGMTSPPRMASPAMKPEATVTRSGRRTPCAAGPTPAEDAAEGHRDIERAGQDQAEAEARGRRQPFDAAVMLDDGERMPTTAAMAVQSRAPCGNASTPCEMRMAMPAILMPVGAGRSLPPRAIAFRQKRVHDGDGRGADGDGGELHPGQHARRRADDLAGLVVLDGALALGVARTGHRPPQSGCGRSGRARTRRRPPASHSSSPRSARCSSRPARGRRRGSAAASRRRRAPSGGSSCRSSDAAQPPVRP